ncbi:MAG: zinc ribbon domain-containing protein [Coriobacteriales bacterium]|nr:zinc ribbon domain-containing protein [Coriobacteriales bacterium]
MFCPKCGAHLPDDARFCGDCGFVITASRKRAARRAAGKAAPVTLPAAPTTRLKHAVPYFFCIVGALAFATCIVLAVRGFVGGINPLVAALSLYDGKIIRIVVLGFALLLLIPCVLCLFGFENCVEGVLRRSLPKKLVRSIVEGFVATTLLALIFVAPRFIDAAMPPQVGLDLAKAIGEALSSASSISLEALWPPLVAAVTLIIAKILAKKHATNEGGVR